MWTWFLECLMELFILFPVCVCRCFFFSIFVYSILNSVWFVNYVWLSMRWLFQGYLSIDALHTFIVAIFNQLIQQTLFFPLTNHTIYALCGFGFSLFLCVLVFWWSLVCFFYSLVNTTKSIQNMFTVVFLCLCLNVFPLEYISFLFSLCNSNGVYLVWNVCII